MNFFPTYFQNNKCFFWSFWKCYGYDKTRKNNYSDSVGITWVNFSQLNKSKSIRKCTLSYLKIFLRNNYYIRNKLKKTILDIFSLHVCVTNPLHALNTNTNGGRTIKNPVGEFYKISLGNIYLFFSFR